MSKSCICVCIGGSTREGYTGYEFAGEGMRFRMILFFFFVDSEMLRERFRVEIRRDLA